MMEAQRLITASEDIVIAEISAACGYMSASCFAAAFKRHFGIPPTKYRLVTLTQRAGGDTEQSKWLRHVTSTGACFGMMAAARNWHVIGRVRKWYFIAINTICRFEKTQSGITWLILCESMTVENAAIGGSQLEITFKKIIEKQKCFEH